MKHTTLEELKNIPHKESNWICHYAYKDGRWILPTLNAFEPFISTYTRIWQLQHEVYLIPANREIAYTHQSVNAAKAAHALMGYP